MLKQSLMSLALVGAVAHAAEQPAAQSQASLGSESKEYFVNLRVNPLNLAFGVVNLDADFKINRHLTVGPTLSYIKRSLGLVSSSAFSIGARANVFPMQDSGLYLAPSLGYIRSSSSVGNDSASTGGLALGALAGYQWLWNSGFNINLGGGFTYYTTASAVTVGSSTVSAGISGILPSLEFALGYAF